jgi:hypothetical protein
VCHPEQKSLQDPSKLKKPGHGGVAPVIPVTMRIGVQASLGKKQDPIS